MRLSRRDRNLSVFRILAAAMLVLGSLPWQGATTAEAASEVVTTNQHVRLGFQLNTPFTAHFGDDITVASYSLDVDGTAAMTVDLGADFQISYDRALVVPGATVPGKNLDGPAPPGQTRGPATTPAQVADVQGGRRSWRQRLSTLLACLRDSVSASTLRNTRNDRSG